MSDLLMPGAVDWRSRTSHRGNDNMVGGPARATHHITDDQLHSDSTRAATLEGVAQYLINVGYEPTVVIDPLTGEAIQLLDATDSGYALEHPAGGPQTNRMGTVNIQVEWLFTPGTVWQGKRYAQVTDTAMLGLDRFVAWCSSWGVPVVAPLAPGDRNASVWAAVAGHYGHFNAPLNSHVDPISPIAAILAKLQAAPPKEAFVPGTHVLTFAHSGLVLDVGGRSTDNGAALVQWPLTGGENQLVRFEDAGNGFVYVVFEHSKKVLDHDANADVLHQIEKMPGNPNQHWQLVVSVGNVVNLRSRVDRKVLDVPGADPTPGVRVNTWPANGGSNQLITITSL